MFDKLEIFNKTHLKQRVFDIRPGDTVRVYQKIREKDKERIQIFEGQVLARKHGKGISATITVRKVISGIGVERIFPIHSPTIEKIKLLKRGRTRRTKLYYLRKAKGKKARIKKIEFTEKLKLADKVEIKKEGKLGEKTKNPPAGGKEKEEEQ